MGDEHQRRSIASRVGKVGLELFGVIVRAVTAALVTVVALFFAGIWLADNVNGLLAVFVWFIVLPLAAIGAFFWALERE